MNRTPHEVERARAQWHYDGGERPPFAVAPAAGQRSVWDFPRPPALEAVAEEVRVCTGDTEIARTSRALRVLETGGPPSYYLPPGDVALARLVPAGGKRSFCEWKGEALYWDLTLEGEPRSRVAWSYSEPFSEFEGIRGWLSFYPARVECSVGGVRVEPQPGRFYGGWVTPDLVGPFKGEPGTEGL